MRPVAFVIVRPKTRIHHDIDHLAVGGRRALMARVRRWHAQIEAARISISSSLSRGMMITGKHFDESRIYRAADAFEEWAIGWRREGKAMSVYLV